jgi:hypothetical protein
MLIRQFAILLCPPNTSHLRQVLEKAEYGSDFSGFQGKDMREGDHV